MNRSIMMTLLFFLTMAIATSTPAEPAFQSKSSDMIEVLRDVPTLNGMRKGLSLEMDGGQQIEVMRQKGLNVGAVREFEPVQRAPAARLNLKVEFDFDSAKVRQSSVPLLSELARSLHDLSLGGARVAINGHTDSIGSTEYNLVLSFRRAKAIRDYLIEYHGVSENRLEVAGFGEALPLVANDTDYNRQINRRVEIERLR